MAFTERLKVIIDVVSDGATRGLAGFRSEVAKADTFTGKLKAGTKQLADTFGSFISSPQGVATAVGTMATMAIHATNQFVELNKAAKDLASATSLSVEQASRWIAVGEDYGISADQIATSIGKLNKSIDADKAAKYGIALTDASGRARGANEIFLDVIDKLSSTDDASKRAKMGTELLGRGWQGLSPILGKSRDEYKRLLATVSEGQIVTDDTFRKTEEYRLALDNLSESFDGLKKNVALSTVELTPLINALTRILTIAGDLGNKDNFLSDIAGFAWDSINPVTFAARAFGDLSDEIDKFTAKDEPGDAMHARLRGLKTAADNAGGSLDSMSGSADNLADSEDDAAAASAAVTEAINTQRAAFKDANQAMQDRLDLQRELYGDQRDAIERTRDFAQAQQELSQTMSDADSTVTEQMDAIIQLSEEYGTLKGASLDSKDGVYRQVEALEAVLSTVKPGSPLAIALKAYIEQLKLIPATVDTQVRLGIIGSVFNQVGDMIGQRFGARALGGPVEADRMYQVAEGGKPELLTDGSGRTFLIPGRDGVVTPITGTTGGSIGGGAPVTFNITVTNPVMSGEQLANQLRAYILRNGSAWLSR